MDTKDSNGNVLIDGDSVTLIKDLKVKSSSQTLKRGTLVKNIRLTNSPAEVEGRAGGSMMVLRTEFLKKA
ncbi:alkylphosphonate utilization protein [Solirubrum puertoriconensis]|uniref:PhnA protein n=1 Tax=Solirubrum puertoriconensis TaxID=1751427 RepID=A0A9X0L4V0_SOLP1|nr:alkylphosphonate utilization protein [Solirubrum puertoriconensis]KUG08043.1 PhnA protein [Solirubrum puertoriconensis]